MKIQFNNYKILIPLFIVSMPFISAINISTCEDLQNINNNLSESYILINNIDCSNEFIPIGNESNPFTGSLNGQNYIISNLIINQSGDYVGLFGYINATISETNESISNVNLRNINVFGNSSVGGLAGENDGNINNCSVTGNISGINYVGGLVGYNYATRDHHIYFNDTGYNFGLINNSHSIVNVNGINRVGGLAGENDIKIENSYSMGNISGESEIGGLVGYTFGDITNSYSDTKVTGSWDIGGLVGLSEAIIESCLSFGNVNGEQYIGGLVGGNFGIINNSNSTGNVTGIDSIGGLIGYEGYHSYNSYSTGIVIGDTNFGNLAGFIYLTPIQTQTEENIVSGGGGSGNNLNTCYYASGSACLPVDLYDCSNYYKTEDECLQSLNKSIFSTIKTNSTIKFGGIAIFVFALLGIYLLTKRK